MIAMGLAERRRKRLAGPVPVGDSPLFHIIRSAEQLTYPIVFPPAQGPQDVIAQLGQMPMRHLLHARQCRQHDLQRALGGEAEKMAGSRVAVLPEQEVAIGIGTRNSAYAIRLQGNYYL